MSDLKEMVKSVTKHDSRIKTICAPLKDCLGISVFGYFIIEQNGSFIDICNHAKSLDLYYDRKLFMQDPYLSHPHLLRSGYLLIPNICHSTCTISWCKHFRMRSFFIVLQSYGDSIEGSYFSTLSTDKVENTVFYSYIDLLLKFIRYFKREAKPLIERMKADHFNIKQAKGDLFFTVDPSTPLSNNDARIHRFLKMVLPLSFQEQRCLDLYKQGKSAQATGEILGLSQRTVESYFDNIKNKLGCSSKAELLER